MLLQVLYTFLREKVLGLLIINNHQSLIIFPHLFPYEKIVAGEEWTLTMSVVWTSCQKADNVTDVTTCEKDTSRPSSYCKVTVYLNPLEEKREVSGFKCIAVDDKTVNL